MNIFVFALSNEPTTDGRYYCGAGSKDMSHDDDKRNDYDSKTVSIPALTNPVKVAAPL